MNEIEAQRLLIKYLDGKCSGEEQSMVEDWFAQLEYRTPPPSHEQMINAHTTVWSKMQGKRPGKMTLIYKLGAIAALLTIVALGYLYLRKALTNQNTIHNKQAEIIRPGTNKATLTLSDGSTITLNDAINGEIANQDGIEISQTADGPVVYGPRHLQGGMTERPISGRSLPAVEMTGRVAMTNTLSTPKGGQYQIHLPDGTKVWLNAASKLIYPVSFNGREERRVQLSGEAYFEVAKDKTHPFIVKSTGQEIKVLGTHFNVNSYPDESNTKTTLLEGSVAIHRNGRDTGPDQGSHTGEEIILKPGQQSILTCQGVKVTQANIKEAMAWKEGKFGFNDATINEVMLKITRWYNIEVRYDGQVTSERFNGTISRNNNMTEVLKMLERTSTVHFKVEGRRVVVMQ